MSQVLGYHGDKKPIFPTVPGQITTRAAVLCCQCSNVIRMTGGPIHDALCVPCSDFIEREAPRQGGRQ